MSIQHLEQLHQRQRGLGLASLVAREGIDAATENLGSRKSYGSPKGRSGAEALAGRLSFAFNIKHRGRPLPLR